MGLPPLGFSTMKPPQDIYFLTEREREREKARCVGEYETKSEKKQSRMKGREIREFGDTDVFAILDFDWGKLSDPLLLSQDGD